jgi:D-alanyl-D-alanine carboxypeptidase/D-alanyl-D-alanine-endopeptidase (penicillin-binding protein 4)
MQTLSRHCCRIATVFVAAAALFLAESACLPSPALAAQPAGRLPSVVRDALVAAKIPAEAVSVWVQDVDAKQPALAFNAALPMNPASVMKIVTSFAALELLGPERVWTTRIAANGPIRENGSLAGNLYLVGDGDPVLTYERAWRLLRRLRGMGVSVIEGDIVLDHSALVLPPHDPSAFDGKGLRPYNTTGDGLLIHFNTQDLALFPGAQERDAVKVVVEPPLAGVAIDNQIVTSGKPCSIWYRDLEARIGENGHLVLSGSLPASCGPRLWATAPLAPPDYSAAMVRALWQELGGRVRGQVKNGAMSPETPILISDASPPLAEIVRTMNKWSNNIIARQLLAQVGRADFIAAFSGGFSPADMVATGIEATKQSLAKAGIETSGLVIENGSGLSRQARVRADTLGTLLVMVWRRPWMPEFIASLPVAGRDGTAYRRLETSPARGYAHLKTGTINDVSSVAGYVLGQNGRRYAVVMTVNHPNAGSSRKAQDALVEWVWAGAR